jgi:glycosyltransferase involved in cell wall biosynthesis
MQKIINSLTILFPVYNDKNTIGIMVDKSQKLIKKYNFPAEILIVDDGCKNGSGEEAERLSKLHDNIRVIHNLTNEGYGAAITKGIKLAKYEWILQTDGDNQYNLEDFHDMVKIIHHYDGLITFRYKKIYESYRIFISWFYNKLVQLIFNSNFRDISTGLRLLKKNLFN